jgi:hypothetical protein
MAHEAGEPGPAAAGITRIENLLASGRFRLAEVREVRPDPQAFGSPAWVAVVERVIEDPDDTTECVFVELKTVDERRWAQRMLG